MRLSVDIGGTFTDIVLENGNALLSKKMLTTTSNPEVAVIKGIEELLNENNISSSRIEIIFHGTTLATNSIIERKGAHTCFITTEGFKDVLDIGYESRFDQYDLLIEKTLSVIPRKNRFVVNERINVDGKVISQIDTDRLKLIADQIDLLNFESIAIGFLHSYVNSKHETIARDFFKKRFPNKLISISSEVCPEIREYERFSTTVINAYIKPLMSKYLQILETLLIEKGFKCPLLLMTSGGSLTNIKNACDFPVRLVESGPAGGAILAASIAEELDLNKDEFYKLVAKSKVMISFALQENFGFSMLEANYLGCKIVVPNRLVYPELYDIDDLYNTFDEACDLVINNITNWDNEYGYFNNNITFHDCFKEWFRS
jgi:N-methylhydantoinase A